MYAIRYKELVKKDEGIKNNMAKKRDKKNKLRGKWLRGIIIVYLFLILCNLFHEFPSRLGNLHSIPVSEEWYLIVVNRWNEIPEDYRVELTELSNGQKMDSRIYPYLQEMFDAARKDGIYPVVREGYRTYEEQQKILDDKIKACKIREATSEVSRYACIIGHFATAATETIVEVGHSGQIKEKQNYD